MTDETTDRIRILMDRNHWSQAQAARYLGVPTGTLGNWLQGTKRPTTIVTRLLDVLETVERWAPHIHVNLLG